MLGAVATFLVAGGVGYADPPPPPTYQQAVAEAYALIAQASPPDTTPADKAMRVMMDGTGGSQPEILSDLRARPPLYADAR